MYFIIGLIICIFIVIIIFSFPQFSPIPYFPSNGKDIPLILKSLLLRSNQTVIDLGAGDGVVIFKAAEKAYQDNLNTKFIAVEINPILLFILYIRRLFHPNRKNIQIVNKDMFSLSYTHLINSPNVTFYIYISPWFIEKTTANIKSQIKKFDLVSYFYQVKFLEEHKENITHGVHKIFSYRS